MIHELKCIPEYFEALASGKKNFDIRRNDRNFQVGDYIALNEFQPNEDPYEYEGCNEMPVMTAGEKLVRTSRDGSYSGRHQLYEITYILDNKQLLPPGYVAMALARVI